MESDFVFQKVCVGGLVHILDEMLTLPYKAVDEITAAGMEYFIAILAKGNFLTTGASYVNPVVYQPNITMFIPNSVSSIALFHFSLANPEYSRRLSPISMR